MKHKITTPYGTAKVYTAKSHKPEAERVLIIPGYSETLAHNKQLVDALATKGFDASTFSQPRGAGNAAHEVNDPIQRQANVLLSLLESVPEGEQVHGVAHSLGAAVVLRAAQEARERFKSITLMQPVGMVGKQSFPELLGRTSKRAINNQAGALKSQDPARQPKYGYAARVDTESPIRYSARVAGSQIAGVGVIAKQLVLAVREARAAGSYDIGDDIAKVKALGIPVNIVQAYSDEMLNTDKVNIGYERIADSVGSYSSVADRNAGHDTFWLQPERTAAIIGQLVIGPLIPKELPHNN